MTNKFSFSILSEDSKTDARAGVFKTPHGDIRTPVFMPVGTAATVKAVSSSELDELGADVILGNTYHLYLRPGHELIKRMGGLHRWMQWNRPILTDSGGFQVFSLGLGKDDRIGHSGSLAKIHDGGVEFRSFIDGSKHFFTPEKVMAIQESLGSDIVMAFDECTPSDADRVYAREAMERTHRWVERCKKAQLGLEYSRKMQALFPIVQGGIYDDLRVESAKFMAALDLPGVAIGGLSVGETKEEMYHTLDVVTPHLPYDKPRYLMGVGTPEDLLEAVARGVDMFDCVLPTRLARHGTFWAHGENGQYERFNIRNERFKEDEEDLDEFTFSACKGFSRSYIRHLFMSREIMGMRLLSLHNLFVLIDLMKRVRLAISDGGFYALLRQYGFKNR